MDERIKSRVRLWLRSERAMGLPSVGPVTADFFAGDVPRADVVAERPPDRPQPKFPVQSPAQRPAPLPGGDEIAPPPEEGLMPPPAADPMSASALSTEDKRRRLIAMDENEVRGCTKCRLCEQRARAVFGEGDPDAKIFFIGEGPGETEDRTGRPFVGRAGELLTKMIAGMGIAREQAYIANIVKCRPPGNRAPAPDEVATCTPYLERQLEIVRPRVIVTLGLPAAQYMLQTKTSMTRLRGNWQMWRGIKLMPTFHPSYILRMDSRDIKAMVWGDLKLVMAELNMPIPARRTSG